MVRLYADEGITGTSTKRRKQFRKLIADCEAGKIDLVITKSVSRFGRNTLDGLEYTRKLKRLGIGVYFEKENVNTLHMDNEMILTFFFSQAQAESESLSGNVKWGHRKNFRDGKVYYQYKSFLGYRKGANGEPEIDEEQAAIVRRIFARYLMGESVGQIRRGLEADGIRTVRGKEFWSDGVIRGMLQNEKYIGDALLQKTYISKGGEGVMKYYVTSDVHGFYTQLCAILTKAGYFDDTEPHKLLVVGDLFDRGREAVELQSFMPSITQVEHYLAKWDGLEDYSFQEEALDKLFFRLCPENTCIEDILLKVSTLNDFYSTHIYSTYPVAKHILALDIDGRLRAGDLSLVKAIQKISVRGTERNFYSFDSKYCSHHNPVAFPIHDSYFDEALYRFMKQNRFASFQRGDLKDYQKFYDILLAFRSFYGLEKFNLKEIDKYLWQLGKDVLSKYGKKTAD